MRAVPLFSDTSLSHSYMCSAEWKIRVGVRHKNHGSLPTLLRLVPLLLLQHGPESTSYASRSWLLAAAAAVTSSRTTGPNLQHPNALQIQKRTPTTGSTHPTCTHNYRRQCLPPRMTKNNPPSNRPVPLRWFRCYACNLNPESTPYVSRCWLHAAAKATSRRKKILGCKN